MILEPLETKALTQCQSMFGYTLLTNKLDKYGYFLATVVYHLY